MSNATAYLRIEAIATEERTSMRWATNDFQTVFQQHSRMQSQKRPKIGRRSWKHYPEGRMRHFFDPQEMNGLNCTEVERSEKNDTEERTAGAELQLYYLYQNAASSWTSMHLRVRP